MITVLKKILSPKYKRSIKERLGVPSLHWSLQNIKRLGFYPLYAIDIGAYEGYWTRDLLEVFPDTKVLMLEAQISKEKKLRELCTEFSNVDYKITLLSGEDGKELMFLENETASHVSKEYGSETKKIKSESLDALLERKKSAQPDFLKLDVQGFELEVLKGSKVAIAHAQFCLLEVTFLNIDDSPLILEVMNFMDKYGFQVYDILQLMRRPYDKALYQIDLLFIKKDSPLIQEKRW